jgi:CheY-like chemotaxis protein
MARILIIDDEQNIRRMMRLALTAAGHEVSTAEDGPGGLLAFGDGSHFDAVLIDQRMPGMEGLDVIRHLHTISPKVPLIMATAFGTIDLAVEAMRLGATDFLRKPFTAETLRGAVAAALQTGTGNPDPVQPPVTYATTTINGFRLEVVPGDTANTPSGLQVPVRVRNPEGVTRDCVVTLPPYVMELVYAYANTESVPGGGRFWQALAEEAMANHLWQNADFPTDGLLTVDELTTSLRRWIDAVMKAA